MKFSIRTTLLGTAVVALFVSFRSHVGQSWILQGILFVMIILFLVRLENENRDSRALYLLLWIAAFTILLTGIYIALWR